MCSSSSEPNKSRSHLQLPHLLYYSRPIMSFHRVLELLGSALTLLLVLLLSNGVAPVQGQQFLDCHYKYFVVNTYGDIYDIVNASCFSTSTDCHFMYYSSWKAFNPIKIGTIAANGTESFKANIYFGGILRSNHEIDVRFYSKVDKSVIQLPRATDSGTKFAPSFSSRYSYDPEVFEDCRIFALGAGASYTVQINNGNPTSHFSGSYQMSRLPLSVTPDKNITVFVNSSHPIIVSCSSNVAANRYFYTWQPISSEPVFAFLWQDYAEVTLTDCITNIRVLDPSRVKVEHGNTSNGFCIMKPAHSASYPDIVYGQNCGLLVTPLDNRTCVSLLKRSAATFTRNMGFLKSRSPLQSGTYSGDYPGPFLAFSNSSENCKYIVNSSFVDMKANNAYNGTLPSGLRAEYSLSNSSDIKQLVCSESVYLYADQEPHVALNSFGSQDSRLWDPIFEAEGCPNSA